ncbi:MAG: 3-phosphoshikimate 1-carboxyvinyltransferase [Candidatus Magnetominusculus sp. LBB02]|nr:3-phosphoshikimate 1-carboxyvinyltransferase [Candidatus Magnetominusculus sp. LBB02]
MKTSSVTLQKAKHLRGEMTPPPDKSISHRAVFFSSLAHGKSTVKNILKAGDTNSTINAFRMLGVLIEELPDNSLSIDGRGFMQLKEPQDVIDCGNSGTTARLLSGVLAGKKIFSVLTGDQSLRYRPMLRVIEPLTQMGAKIFSRDNNCLPMAIKGGSLKAIEYRMRVASAQVKSAIMLAGLFAAGETVIEEPVKSRDHTERMLKAYGADVRVDGLKVTVRFTGDSLTPCDIAVPADISSAAFFSAGALMVEDAQLMIKDVGLNPTRAGFIDVLKKMGADVKVHDEKEVSGEITGTLLCKYTDRLQPVTLSEKDIPSLIDEFPILCVLATRASGVTEIRGATELRVKESDRISSIVTELRKMGAKIEEYPDGVAIEGPVTLRGSDNLQSYGDHRIAMALSIAAISAEGESVIHGTDAVGISYPDFYDTLKRLTH